MKKTINQIRLLTILLLPITNGSFSQDMSKELPHFNKIFAGPHIELTLKQGEHEKIGVTSENVSPDNVIIEVKHEKLRIYLVDWRKHEIFKEGSKTFKADRYRNSKVYATVTFNQLRTLVAIGEERITSDSKIENDIFRLRIYGEAKVFLQRLEAKKLKSKLFGENEVVIQSGEIVNHKSKLFGENSLTLINLRTQKTKCTSLGENEFAGNSVRKFKVSSLGESEFRQYGSAKIHKMIVLGENKCSKANKDQ
jgi:hypothetical protein